MSSLLKKRNRVDSTLRSVLLNGTIYVVGADLTSSRVELDFGSQVFVYQFS